jgi:ketosteroid isomerase-like protein
MLGMPNPEEKKPMHKVIITLAVTALTTATLLASEQTDVMATVNQLVASFNNGDTKSLLAACTDEMSIIDEFPPHEWHGAGTCSKWLADYDADAKKNGIADGVVTIGKPRHVDVTADRAYVVVPANYTYKQHGKPMKETNSTWTFTLQKVQAGWRVTGWAWAKH